MNTNQAADKWNCDRKLVAKWCREDKVADVKKEGIRWLIPDDAKRPIDRRLQREILWRILELKNGFTSRFDMTAWGLTDEDLDGYLAALCPLLIRTDFGKCKPDKATIKDVYITEAGFRLLGRKCPGNEKIATPQVLLWCADASGLFVRSAIANFINGMAAG